MNNVLPTLPEGFKIQQKPAFVETKSQYGTVVETLKIMDATKCVEKDISGLTDNQVNAIMSSIRNSAKKMKFNQKIRFANKDLGGGLRTMYIFSNK